MVSGCLNTCCMELILNWRVWQPIFAALQHRKVFIRPRQQESDGAKTKNAPGARESGGVSWMLSGTSGSRNIHVLGRSTVTRPETALVDVASTAASRRPPIPSNPDSRIAAYRNVNPLTRAVFPATTAIDGWRRTPAMTSESIATPPLPREHRSNISVSVSLSIIMKHGCFLC